MSCNRFANVASCPSASCIELLLAAAREFGRVDVVATHALLDDFARPLFGLASSPPQAQAERLLRLMTDDLHFVAHGRGDTDQLLLPRVIDSRRGHPLILAIIAHDLAQRAGFTAAICSSPTQWFIGLDAVDHLLLVGAGLRGGEHAPVHVRQHCRHELTYCALTGLSQSFAECGQLARARCATRMKLALPISEELRTDVERELNALNPASARP